jgi:hypothetical protein
MNSMKALMALLLLNTLAVFQAHAACTREVTVIELRADEVARGTDAILTFVNGMDATGDVLNAYRAACAGRVAILVRPDMRFDAIDEALFAIGKVGAGKASVFVVSPENNWMQLMDRLVSMRYNIAPEYLLEIMRNPPDHSML